MKINQNIQKLDQAVEWFYGDEFNLDQAAERYQQALSLAQEINQNLKDLKNHIEVIDKDFTKNS